MTPPPPSRIRPSWRTSTADWITCRFEAGEAGDLDLLKRWIAESYRAVAPKKLAALVPAQD